MNNNEQIKYAMLIEIARELISSETESERAIFLSAFISDYTTNDFSIVDIISVELLSPFYYATEEFTPVHVPCLSVTFHHDDPGFDSPYVSTIQVTVNNKNELDIRFRN